MAVLKKIQWMDGWMVLIVTKFLICNYNLIEIHVS